MANSAAAKLFSTRAKGRRRQAHAQWQVNNRLPALTLLLLQLQRNTANDLASVQPPHQVLQVTTAAAPTGHNSDDTVLEA
jgi:hypothetical protein